MTRRPNHFCLLALTLLPLAGCAAASPPTQADQADNAACTAQADASYNAQNYDQLSRTSQNGVRYGATPTHVFDAQQMGALHARDSQLSDCLKNGSTAPATPLGATIVKPQIID